MNKIENWAWNLRKLVHRNTPVPCFSCRVIKRRKFMKYERYDFGPFVPLCSNCHEHIFKPFSAKFEKDKE